MEQRRRNQQDRLDEVVAAGAVVFARHGYRRAQMADVARALVERYRSDLTATVVQERLRQDLAQSGPGNTPL